MSKRKYNKLLQEKKVYLQVSRTTTLDNGERHTWYNLYCNKK